SRGGRNRKKKPDGAAAEGVADDAAASPKATNSAEPKTPRKPAAKPKKAAEKAPAEAAEKKRRERQPRRRAAPRRAPLPKAKRELLVSVDAGERRVAVLEDDRVAEVYLERPERRSIAGNIYKGVVDNVLPGMEAAFVEIGLEKNGFLYVDEIVVPELEGKRHGKRIQDLLSRGQEILVQAVKDPMKTKGARLTTEISLPGRFVVFVPQGEGIGVSRRLDDHERSLKRINGYLKKTSPHMAERVHRYRERPTLFEAYGVEGEIRSTLSRRVDLPSGGYLVFDYAEAFTVIDVNTGRFVGSRSKSSGARLEDTITANNLEAVKEVVHQLRLRDIGGIIVIDFIDMANPKNRA